MLRYYSNIVVLKVTQKIKVEEITLENLVEEALSIPNGWKEEVYVENGQVVFLRP